MKYQINKNKHKMGNKNFIRDARLSDFSANQKL